MPVTASDKDTGSANGRENCKENGGENGEEIVIGILSYPGALISASYGLMELFGSCNRITGRVGSAESSQGAALPRLRGQQWQLRHGGGEVSLGPMLPGDRPAPKLKALVVLPCLEGDYYRQPDPLLGDWIADLHRNGTVICSVCAGAFVLGASGLLDRRRVTTHWNLAAKLQQQFPAIELDADQIIIDNQDLITAGGVMAWLDLGLYLVERFTRPGIALELGKLLLIDTGRREQRFYRGFVPPLDHGDSAVLKAQHHIHRHFDQPLAVAELAQRSHMVERTFYRNFQRQTGYNPGEYIQRIRIQKARELIETRPLSVEQVGWQVGYEDISAFRKMFRKLTGLSPGQYKQRFARL